MNEVILPLLPEKARPYTKAIFYFLNAVLVGLSQHYTDNEALTVALLVFGQLGVYGLANAPQKRGRHARIPGQEN